MKVIAFYLPQYHTFPENDEWWGKGFTEWTNLRKAKPLFEGHYQPRIPLNHNYYDLSDVKVMEWQCKIAKEYGVYGFCFYHYWFDRHMLMQKPMENYLHDKNCNLPFCICWANEHWTRAWESKQNTVLIEQRYGDYDQWRDHFNYFLPFLKDDRYIKENNKPMIVIYRPELIDCLNDMLDCWSKLAKKNGFDGLTYLYQHVSFDNLKNKDDSRFTYAIEYQPGYAWRDKDNSFVKGLKDVKRKLNTFTEKHFNRTIDLHALAGEVSGPTLDDYDTIWNTINSRIPPTKKYIPCALTDWDNTPRRGTSGRTFVGASPQKFKKYFSEQVRRTKTVYKKDMLFIFAWNEWTEGGYLEPDEKYGYGYLKAIREALEENKELPE